MQDKDQKTEQATPKKRRDERKRGNVFSSRDVVNLLSILLVFFFLRIYFPTMIKQLTQVVYQFMGLAASGTVLTVEFARVIFKDVALALAIIILPLAGVAILAAVIGTGMQTRFNFSAEALKPKFSRLNPLQGLKRMFSMKSLVELLKSFIKIIVILLVVYNFFMNNLETFARTMQMGVVEAVGLILGIIMDLIYQVCIIFVFIAAVDYFFQWWNYEKDLRMTKQEVKEEYKQIEGDPQVKGKIKQQQRKMAMSRMMQQVPTADVVIRNPTHYAIAMRYDIERDNAPIIVAKGQDYVAARIVAIAEENDIFVTEDVELTRAIYAIADIGDEVPFEFYRAVAELLAMVYQLKNIKV